MEPFAIQCATCKARLKVRELAAVGQILACPKCGGTQFKAKRSARGKVIGTVTLGVGGVLAPKSRVRCVACKTECLRG